MKLPPYRECLYPQIRVVEGIPPPITPTAGHITPPRVAGKAIAPRTCTLLHVRRSHCWSALESQRESPSPNSPTARATPSPTSAGPTAISGTCTSFRGGRRSRVGSVDKAKCFRTDLMHTTTVIHTSVAVVLLYVRLLGLASCIAHIELAALEVPLRRPSEFPFGPNVHS